MSRLSEDLCSSSSSSSDPDDVTGTGTGRRSVLPVPPVAATLSIPSSGRWNHHHRPHHDHHDHHDDHRHRDQQQEDDFLLRSPEESSSTPESYHLDYPDGGDIITRVHRPRPPPPPTADFVTSSSSSQQQQQQQRSRQLSQQQQRQRQQRPPLPSSSQPSYHPPPISQHQQQQQYVPHPPERYNNHQHYAAAADQGSIGGGSSSSKGGGRPTTRRRTAHTSLAAAGAAGGSNTGATASGHHHHRRKHHHHNNRNRRTPPNNLIQQQPSVSSDWSVTSEHSSTSYYSNNSSAVISQRRGHHGAIASVNPTVMNASSTQYNMDGSGSRSGGIHTAAATTTSTTIQSQLPSYYSSSTSSLFGLNSSSVSSGINNMVAPSQSSSSLQRLINNNAGGVGLIVDNSNSNNTYDEDHENDHDNDDGDDDDSYDGKTKRYNRRSTTRFDYWGNSSFNSMRRLAYYRDTASSPTNNHNNNNHHHQQQPHLPSLQSIFFELVLICSLKCRYTIRSLRRPCRTFHRRLFYGSVTVLLAVFMLIAWLTLDFYMDAVDVCTPPPPLPPVVYHHVDTAPPRRFESFLAQMDAMNSNINDNDVNNMVPTNMTNSDRSRNVEDKHNNEQEVTQQEQMEEERPLVEYYVHGRGIGHYARSVAIVEQLNKAGVDVRLFLTRSAMWRAMHEDSKMVDGAGASAAGGDEDPNDHSVDESTTPTASTVNAQLAKLQQPSKHRGHTTAISISSLTPDQSIFDVISHIVERVSGDCEVAASSGRYPQLIISDGDFPGMLRAEFGGIPSVGIAHGQLFSIAQKPSWVQRVPILNRAWNKQGRLNYVSGFFTEWQIATHFCFLESRYSSGTVARAPLRPEVLHMAEARKDARNGKFDPERLPQQSRIKKLLFHDSLHRRRRKLVICYFRDHNGEIVVQALLNAGFDVLLFDTGYYRDMQNDPNRYGVKWIIDDREEARKIYIRGEQERRRLTEEETLLMQQNSTLDEESYPILHRRLSVKPKGPRLIRITDRSLFVPLMHVADGVASSAGSQLMSECIYSHMPLLALYKENDDEQRLNVELSHHTDAPCHRPLVFGTSFERLTSGLHKNNTSHGEPPSDSLGQTLDQLYKFVQEVRASPTSETYFRSLFNETINDNTDQKAKTNPIISAVDGLDMDKDPFQGLPDAAAIILEIVKQVLQK